MCIDLNHDSDHDSRKRKRVRAIGDVINSGDACSVMSIYKVIFESLNGATKCFMELDVQELMILLHMQ